MASAIASFVKSVQIHFIRQQKLFEKNAACLFPSNDELKQQQAKQQEARKSMRDCLHPQAATRRQ
jgi:hypothetical protein